MQTYLNSTDVEICFPQQSCYLRVENKTQVIHAMGLKKEVVQKYLDSPGVKICHPQCSDWLFRDSSRMVFLSLMVLSSGSWFFALFKTCRDHLPELLRIQTCSSPLLPVHQVRNNSKNWFRNLSNLGTASMVFVMMLLCYHSDGQNLKQSPAQPFLEFDDGFLFIELFLLLLALYFVVDNLNKMFTQKQHWSNWAQLIDPSSTFQLVSCISAIVALIAYH